MIKCYEYFISGVFNFTYHKVTLLYDSCYWKQSIFMVSKNNNVCVYRPDEWETIL